MSKYKPLWEFIAACPEQTLTLSFDRVAEITGFAFDHAFLSFKKELADYGWRFVRLSLNSRWVSFDNSYLCDFSVPGITSLSHKAHAEPAAAAADALLTQMRGKAVDSVNLGFELMERASCISLA